jgi:polyphosphate kinase
MNLKDHKYYFNRELSWLKFNERVLEEAEDTNHPLLERMKFIAIFSSNLDEFYMIRVAGLKDQIAAGIQDIAADGLTPQQVLKQIAEDLHKAVTRQASILAKDILPKLHRKGIRLRKISSLRKPQKQYLQHYFKDKVYPILTPLAIDPTHPFPQLKSLGMNLMVEMRTPYKSDHKVAVINIPSSLPRFINLPTDNGRVEMVLMEDLIKSNVGQLFPGMKIITVAEFRITRNADLDLSEAEADDLLKLIERELRKRRLGTVIRLELTGDMTDENRNLLMEITGLTELDVYDVPSYLDLAAFMYFMKLNYPELKDKPFSPALNQRFVKNGQTFRTMRRGDVLLHHPYDSFNHVVDFVQEAAIDPKVLAIKQTLYRTSGDSRIVRALKTAVNNGKQVTALIELKARFDEQNNIDWAKELDRSGVNVVYGVLGLKTHCKICMVVRKEEDRIRRYLHLGTGNYNETTAKIYTDFSLMTCDEEMGEDASGLFNLLTGYSQQKKWNKFFIAPATLRTNMISLVRDCIKNHSDSQPSRIMMVMNSLVDPGMIQELYKASMAGIKISLVVRGICCLRPGIKGVSDNITVKSIVGRFLEHTRVFYFKYKGESVIFLGSADMMQRNLNRRVELIFPVEDPSIKRYVRGVLQHMLDDDMKSRLLQKDGSYVRVAVDQKFNVQEFLLSQASERQKETDTILNLSRS